MALVLNMTYVWTVFVSKGEVHWARERFIEQGRGSLWYCVSIVLITTYVWTLFVSKGDVQRASGWFILQENIRCIFQVSSLLILVFCCMVLNITYFVTVSVSKGVVRCVSERAVYWLRGRLVIMCVYDCGIVLNTTYLWTVFVKQGSGSSSKGEVQWARERFIEELSGYFETVVVVNNNIVILNVVYV